MSIASEIQRINTNIGNAYSKVSEKGGTLPITQNSANLASAINSIQTGGSSNVLVVPDGMKFASSSTLGDFQLDTSNVTDMSHFFQNTTVTQIPLIDTSNATIMLYCFYQCTNLIEIPLLNTSKNTNMQEMFRRCYNLTTIPVLDTSNVINMYFAFYQSQNLSNETLNNILRMCINAVKIPSNNKSLQHIGLSSSQATICQSLSNWNDFVSAGWRTGY